MQHLPTELLEIIFTFSPNPLLHRVNHRFYAISKSDQRKVEWLINRYGQESVLSYCWNLKFMCQTPDRTECGCKSKRASDCLIEARQLRMVHALLAKGCTLKAGNERCLEVAARQGHYQLLSYLLYRGGDPNASPTYAASWFIKPKLKHKFMQVRRMHESEIRGPKRASLFLNAVRRNDLLLIELLLNEPMSPIVDAPILGTANSNISPYTQPDQLLVRIGVSDSVLNASLSVALLRNLPEMAQLLFANGGHTSPSVLGKLFFRANIYRILTGSCTSFTPRISTALQSMTLEDFDLHQDRFVRCCAELGGIEGMMQCIQRGVNVNHENGLALYTSMYCGNALLTRYLVEERGADVGVIGAGRFTFCIGMITVEILAICLVLLLGVIWVFQVSFGGDVGGLTAMIVPTALALVVMYRFVPVHSVLRGMLVVRKRQRELENRVLPV